MQSKTPSLIGAGIGLALFLAVALLPAMLYGGYAGVLLAGGIFGTPLAADVPRARAHRLRDRPGRRRRRLALRGDGRRRRRGRRRADQPRLPQARHPGGGEQVAARSRCTAPAGPGSPGLALSSRGARRTRSLSQTGRLRATFATSRRLIQRNSQQSQRTWLHGPSGTQGHVRCSRDPRLCEPSSSPSRSSSPPPLGRRSPSCPRAATPACSATPPAATARPSTPTPSPRPSTPRTASAARTATRATPRSTRWAARSRRSRTRSSSSSPGSRRAPGARATRRSRSPRRAPTSPARAATPSRRTRSPRPSTRSGCARTRRCPAPTCASCHGSPHAVKALAFYEPKAEARQPVPEDRREMTRRCEVVPRERGVHEGGRPRTPRRPSPTTTRSTAGSSAWATPTRRRA